MTERAVAVVEELHRTELESSADWTFEGLVHCTVLLTLTHCTTLTPDASERL
jgi:hypothetical protein